MEISYLKTPVGWLKLTVIDHCVAGIERAATGRKGSSRSPSRVMNDLRTQLTEYFAGERKAFNLPLKPTGTAFQWRVWNRMARIPFGQTMSYGDLAAAVGTPGGARAIGSVCGRNPWLILIPCHRVLAAHGKIGGFSGGVRLKRRILALENITPAESLSQNENQQ
ncbi:MAG: methylated-DNA--[protein]-cysteine S-methyltransferase [Bdellovibrionales bacterium]|nr:methylated-DNA--[protein]-cysteine S-methyltransferase [Bdellovibrionales bacterium]